VHDDEDSGVYDGAGPFGFGCDSEFWVVGGEPWDEHVSHL